MRKLLVFALCFFCASAVAQPKPDFCIHLSTHRTTLQPELPELAKSAADAITKQFRLSAISVQEDAQDKSCTYRLNMEVEFFSSFTMTSTTNPRANSSPAFQNELGERQLRLSIEYDIASTNAASERRHDRYDRTLTLSPGSNLDYDSDPMLRNGVNAAAIAAARKTLKTRR
jgi:hypothetical protein